MSENQGAGDSKTHSEVWNEIAQEEAGQAASAPQDASERLDPPAAEEVSGQPASEQEQERQGPDAGDSQPAGSETADDIWANATPAQREHLQALEDRAKRAENTLSSNNGRWSNAQRELNELRAKIQAQPAPRGDAATNGKEAASGSGGGDDAELRKVAEEYPEILAPAVKAIAELRGQIAELSTDRSRRNELDQAQANLAVQERMAREEQALAENHPDWNEVVRTQAFADWYQTQPRMVMEALQRNGQGIVDGAEAAKILSDFKRDTGTPAAPDPLALRRERQMEASRHIPARQGAAPGQGSGGSYSDEWKRLAAEEQRREASRR